MAADIRDILEVDRAANPLGIEKIKKKVKRPEGMAREVYALLCIDKDTPTLIPTDTDQSYKHTKAKLGLRKVRAWKWVPFNNPARTDSAVFYHWRREMDEGKEYPFAKFNKKIDILLYTDAEYIQYLKSDDWCREETDHLFDLCHRFDLRFVVIQDRFDKDKYKPRTIEDLKDRYYFITNTLYRVRHQPGTPFVEPKAFDADHERRRKEQLKRLFDRTAEQIEEEQMLMQELRKIEARKKERERKTQDLQKLISGDSAFAEARKHDRRPFQRRKVQNPLKNRPPSNQIEMVGIKFSDFRSSGVSLRSSRMRLPANIGQKKVKIIEQALKELELEVNPVPTDETSILFNDLRSDLIVLNEIKNAISTCVFEIQTFKHQYEALKPGETLEIPEILLSHDEDKTIKCEENSVQQ